MNNTTIHTKNSILLVGLGAVLSLCCRLLCSQNRLIRENEKATRKCTD